MDETDVIVVGAGPTGQTLALTLARHGVRPRIVDELPVRSDKSRALIVQARSLETFRLLGVADEILKRGQHGIRIRPHANGRQFGTIEIGEVKVVDTRYPFTFLVSQVDTEEVLDQGLANAGIEVERPVKATAFETFGDGVVVTLRGPSGERKVKAKYVVGCDGAHSVVRKAAGLSFEGAAYPQTFLLADVHCDQLPSDELSFFFGSRGLVAVIPLGKAGLKRLIVAGTVDGQPIPEEPTLDDLRRLVEEIGNQRIEISDPTWVTRFRLHHRGVDRYRSGRFFVAGDAAHIHSPAGGQGMNTGIQDAQNLGWKLALALQGKAGERLLDSYHEERYPIGQQLMKTTDRLFTLMTSDSRLVSFARVFVVPRMFPRMMRSPVRREAQFRFASQLGMSYPNSPVVRDEVPKNAAAVLRAAPAAGSRVPDGPTASTNGAPWLHDLLRRTPKHHLVVIVRGLGADARAAAIREAEEGCRARREVVDPIVLEEGPVAEQLAGHGRATYLVRPDNVIAFRAPDVAIARALRHLDATLAS